MNVEIAISQTSHGQLRNWLILFFTRFTFILVVIFRFLFPKHILDAICFDKLCNYFKFYIERMFIFSIVIVFSCLTFRLSRAKSGTHFVLSGNRVRLVEDSFFQLKDPGDLCAFLKQEQIYEQFIDTSLELIRLKKTIQDDEGKVMRNFKENAFLCYICLGRKRDRY